MGKAASFHSKARSSTLRHRKKTSLKLSLPEPKSSPHSGELTVKRPYTS
ncbi:hypothetical protein COLO4_29937 [Corchorus olitorius]|uniref:Uncharacterized protein n=1 Tax=Corchorus olitorius TaxID=93759 RepID=A0A1R3HCD6_9ROSI|nr:hypothetical protein COLO4_29937 [Corchorus olitorius]